MKASLALLIAPVLLAAMACAPAAPAAPATATTAPAAAATRPASAPVEVAPAKYVLVPASSEVRYRVKETLLGAQLPTEALGKTSAVTGTITFDKLGAVDAAQSKFSFDAASFRSVPTLGVGARNAEDLAKVRDTFVKDRLLHADKFPTIDFVPTKVTGLTTPFPTTGKVDFQMAGDLTANGVKKAITFDVSASFKGAEVTGTAKGKFTFPDFGIEKPTLASILTIEDTMSLELDFTVNKQG